LFPDVGQGNDPDDLAVEQRDNLFSPDFSHKKSASGRRISESCFATTTFG
jgi:hypothetical protein